MPLNTQPYKGARDFYPADKRVQKYMFSVIRDVAESFGYQEYDAPLLEPLELYQAKTGDEIVDEQTYAFKDRGGREVVIRPEMTPSVSRMVAARRQDLAYPLRLFNIGRRWRYERPQRGRNREFWQADIDLFGVETVEGDAEIIQVADAVLRSLGARSEMYRININSRRSMVASLKAIGISEDELKGVYKLVDKMPKLDEGHFDQMIAEHLGAERAGELRDFLSSGQPPENVRRLLDMLKAAGVDAARYEPSVVRGLDYYTDIVFEVFDTNPDNARAMFGGGRYDGLVGQFGVEPVPTVGFAIGDVTLQNFLEVHHLLPVLKTETDVIVMLIGDVYEQAQEFLTHLRQRGVNVAVDATGRKLDTRLRHAAKSGVDGVFFLGPEEINNRVVKAKHFGSGQERSFGFDEIDEAIDRWLDQGQ